MPVELFPMTPLRFLSRKTSVPEPRRRRILLLEHIKRLLHRLVRAAGGHGPRRQVLAGRMLFWEFEAERPLDTSPTLAEDGIGDLPTAVHGANMCRSSLFLVPAVPAAGRRCATEAKARERQGGERACPGVAPRGREVSHDGQEQCHRNLRTLLPRGMRALGRPGHPLLPGCPKEAATLHAPSNSTPKTHLPPTGGKPAAVAETYSGPPSTRSPSERRSLSSKVIGGACYVC